MTAIGFALYIAIALFAGYKTWKSLDAIEFDAVARGMIVRNAEFFGVATIIIAMLYYAPLIASIRVPFFGATLLATYAFMTWAFIVGQKLQVERCVPYRRSAC